MMTKIRFLIGIALVLSSLPSHADCGGYEISFSFTNLKVVKAYSMLSDFAELELDFDPEINESGPIKFDCMNWKEAAVYIAEEFELKITIKDGVMRVRR